MRTVNVVCERCAGRGGYNVTTPAQLRKARKAAKLTLAQAAEATGLSVAYLCQMETGARPVTARVTAAYECLPAAVGALPPKSLRKKSRGKP